MNDSPLSDRRLRGGLDVRRHPTPGRERFTTTFEIRSDDEDEPSVDLRRNNDGSWRVEVSATTRGSGTIRPASPEPVHVPRQELAAMMGGFDLRELGPSLPEDAELPSSFSPQRLRKERDWSIRFGRLRYQPTTIFNPDGRRPYYDTNYPWRCLVRITTPRGWAGSGVLIGPRHVLTASHCVDWTPGWFQVDVLYTNGSSLATAYGTRAYYSTKVGPGQISDEDSDEDYAVIVLDQRLGDRYGWLGSRTYDGGWDDEQCWWRSIGYPQDFSSTGQTAAYQRDFLLNELGWDYGSARLIRSDTFDNWPGQSGSPVFGFWSDGPHVVGVVSGQGSDYNYISGGSLLPSLVKRARDENP